MRHRIQHVSLLIAAPALLSHCSTAEDGSDGNANSAGTTHSVSGASGSGSGSGASSNGGRATSGAGGAGESGRSQGGAGGTGSGGPTTGGVGPGGETGAGSAGAPTGGLGGVAGRLEGGQGGIAIGGAGAGSGGGNPGGAGGKSGAGGGGSGGKASGGAGGVGGGGAGSGGGFSCNPTCGAGMMCCPSNALTTSCVQATTAGCLAPDLIVSAARAEDTVTVEYRNFPANHCAITEQCIEASGRRRLLRFETFTPNIGTADMRLGVPNTSNPVFEYSACHDHFHFTGYAEYDLLDAFGTVVATGHKQAFCLLDSERYVTSDSTVRRTPQYQCGNQGITRGWGDSYTPDLDCQWVDVTDVPPGNYQLRIRINQSHTLLELRYDNNEALVPVRIP